MQAPSLRSRAAMLPPPQATSEDRIAGLLNGLLQNQLLSPCQIWAGVVCMGNQFPDLMGAAIIGLDDFVSVIQSMAGAQPSPPPGMGITGDH